MKKEFPSKDMFRLRLFDNKRWEQSFNIGKLSIINSNDIQPKECVNTIYIDLTWGEGWGLPPSLKYHNTPSGSLIGPVTEVEDAMNTTGSTDLNKDNTGIQ